MLTSKIMLIILGYKGLLLKKKKRAFTFSHLVSLTTCEYGGAQR